MHDTTARIGQGDSLRDFASQKESGDSVDSIPLYYLISMRCQIDSVVPTHV